MWADCDESRERAREEAARRAEAADKAQSAEADAARGAAERAERREEAGLQRAHEREEAGLQREHEREEAGLQREQWKVNGGLLTACAITTTIVYSYLQLKKMQVEMKKIELEMKKIELEIARLEATEDAADPGFDGEGYNTRSSTRWLRRRKLQGLRRGLGAAANLQKGFHSLSLCVSLPHGPSSSSSSLPSGGR